MKIKVWTRITDIGEGSSAVFFFPTQEKALEGLDEYGFDEDEMYCEVDYQLLDLSDGYEKINQ